ncbi:hypothetical protein [Burkholderia sp. Ac-20344]|uniref:hypothetical protein n=1 Tax=Burkholderia sp. Ac-20344 TaxID=2703890 RepID=UPI00197BCAB5|nr:hypothetical protein [Burkholderia sp. Ac-20344]MBN3833170.1 hypothetical protein [Burkholderia sp. Ac-20344]
MRYPNLRYGKPEEFRYYMNGRTAADVARELRRSERSVADWMSGRQRVPWWAPEILRLRAVERDATRLRFAFNAAWQPSGLETPKRERPHLRIVA